MEKAQAQKFAEDCRRVLVRALKKYPKLHFKLLHVLRGANSVTLIYEGVLGLSAVPFRALRPSGASFRTL